MLLFVLFFIILILKFCPFLGKYAFSPFCIIYCQFSTQGSHPTTQTFSTAFPGEIHIYVLNISHISPLEYISSTISLVHSTSFFTGATVTPYLVYCIYSGLLQSIFHLGIRGGVPKVQIWSPFWLKPLKASHWSQDQAKSLWRGRTPPSPFSCYPLAPSLHSRDTDLLPAPWDHCLCPPA